MKLLNSNSIDSKITKIVRSSTEYFNFYNFDDGSKMWTWSKKALGYSIKLDNNILKLEITIGGFPYLKLIQNIDKERIKVLKLLKDVISY